MKKIRGFLNLELHIMSFEVAHPSSRLDLELQILATMGTQ
jgi:hypothetical protein